MVAGLFVAAAAAWTVVDETWTRRPWKQYQEDFRRLELRKSEEALAACERVLGAPEVQTRRDSLLAQIEAAEVAMAGPEMRAAGARLRRQERVLDALRRRYQFAKSESDELYYRIRKSRRDGVPRPDLQKRLRTREASFGELARDIQAAEKERAQIEAAPRALRSQAARAREVLEGLTAERDRLLRSIDLTRRRPLAIRQIMLRDFDRNEFGNWIPRVDRCTTCHLGVEDPAFEGAPEPFSRHSYILDSHPVEKFGCTVCHGGQGMALTVRAAHGVVEFWEAPLVPDGDRERLCGRCHQEGIGLPEASTLSEGRKLFETSGCLGCHNVEGYVRVPNIGPPLEKIHTKVRPGWLLRWILDPKEYLPATRMPNFRFSEEQARAIQAYLLSPLSRGGDPASGTPRRDGTREGPVGGETYAGRERDARVRPPAPRAAAPLAPSATAERLIEEGRLVFGVARCVSCHALNGKGGTIGPDLGKIGRKVRPEWLSQWLKRPQAYQPNTRMSRYRFSERELAALTAYLLTLGAEQEAELDEPLPSFGEDEVRRGKKLMEEYGCLGCHDPVGQERAGGKVGADLTTFGEKLVEALDFGDILDVERSLPGWVQAKLQNPRRFSTERIQLKMPDYGFSQKQARALSTVLLGFADEAAPVGYLRPRATNSGSEPPGAFGELVRDLNCLTCHSINGRGGDLAPDLSAQGSRANAPWLREYLNNPYTLRPTLVERMPKFHLTDEEIEILVNYMTTALVRDDIPKAPFSPERITDTEIREGRRLYEDVYRCQTCHQIRYKGGTMGPELVSSDTNILERRTLGWIYAWIKNPRRLDPRTKEPVLGLSDEEALLVTKYLVAASEGRDQ